MREMLRFFALVLLLLLIIQLCAPGICAKGAIKDDQIMQREQQPNFTATPPDPSPLPQFALCLSGELRTFSATAPRFREFVASNPVVDTFGFIGFVHPTEQHVSNHNSSGHAAKYHLSARSKAASAHAPTEAERITRNWPGLIRNLSLAHGARSGAPVHINRELLTMHCA